MDNSPISKIALYYARATQPLDPEQGWRIEDIQLAFMSGMQEHSVRRLLSTREVANVLGVSVSTIRDLVRHGELSYVQAGRGMERKHLLFSADEIENFIKRHTKRDYSAASKTTRHGTRKTEHELALERATVNAGGFLAMRAARRAARVQAKKAKP